MHYYSWVGRWFGVHPQQTPAQLALTDKPIVIGEISAIGVYTQNTSNQDVFVMNTTQCYETAYQNGWQGVMAWTSNGVDSNGGMTQLAPATQAFRNNHFSLVFPNENPGGRLRTEGEEMNDSPDVSEEDVNFVVYPNPTSEFLSIKQAGTFDVEIYNMQGNQVFQKAAVIHSVSVNVKHYATGMYIVKINDQKGVRMKKFVKD